jgi:endonuclease/exonuclease/phosphatase family metal-dependent hydrolase
VSVAKIRAVIVAAILVSLWTGLGWAQALRVVGFNVESGGARPDVLDDLIAAAQGVDIWGFSEVHDVVWATLFAKAAEHGEAADFKRILGSTGASDRLLIVYNADRLDVVRHFELSRTNVGGNVRAPLVAHFRFKPAGAEFLFMVNHLYRSKAERRHEQARLLNEWARSQTLPVIAVGDYNFDWDVSNGEADHDQGYDLLIQDEIFVWIRPQRLIKTQCSFESVLDFTFVAGDAKRWRASSEILAAHDTYCPDDNIRSDQRPVLAMFQLSADGERTSRQLLLARIQRMEEELRALKTLVEQMPE